MTMSIRARLLLATVALVALGLLAADSATYVFLRSSLIHRLDQQLEAAQPLATRALLEDVVNGLMPGLGFANVPGQRRGSAPSATFTELLDPSGAVVVSRSFGFGVVDVPPHLPAGLPGSSAQRDSRSARFFTAGATGGSSIRYRVLAAALAGGEGTVVVAYPLGDVDATLHRLLLVEGLATAVVLAGIAALALWLVRLGLRPLENMGRAADAIAAGDLSRRVEPAEPRTEVGRLGIALNAMLERIETAFAARQASEARLRRFVSDASHELRTPLTSIRGYAELFRRGADTRPDDLAKTMRRIEEESSRMGTLVEELLLLARLDEGRPLERRPVDLARLVSDAVHDARVIEPDRPIDLEITEPVVVDGDEVRLRQVAPNLLTNAFIHTPARTPIHVRVITTPGEAVLEVADEGPGLSEEEANQVFDRFFRSDPSRSRQSGGVGLGLSIVAAIAQAHGGRAWVETSPGAGAVY
ncbi:MAG: HAMP domain-containing sensor histidine kinase, partial [Actinomycetota bacterium]